MKTCKTCGVAKPLKAGFYRLAHMPDGHFNECKECWKARVKRNRESNRDHYIAYDKARAKRPDRVEARKQYATSDHGRAICNRAKRNYYKRNTAKVAATKRAWIERNPHKRRAHEVVNNAIRDGHLTPKPCERCGKKGHAHHEDYTKALDIMWLCTIHHRARHKELEAQGIKP